VSNQLSLCLSILCLLLPAVAQASTEDGEREAILDLMEKAFEAVGSGDPDDLRAIQLAEGTSLSFRPDPNGNPGQLEMRMSTNEALLLNDVDDGRKFLERWTAEPTVLIRGPIASVWGEYEFWIDGAFSHCGVDSVALAKVDGEWKIANWLWTVEKEHCPTAPRQE